MSDHNHNQADPHEFDEDVNDASMCMCGVPALSHHLVEPGPVDLLAALQRSIDSARAARREREARGVVSS